MYEVTVERTFSAAHNLRGYAGCCENLHGHNWRVEVAAATETLDELGLAVDFRALKQALEDVLAAFDHRYLNEIPPFDQVNPSCENLAQQIHDRLAGQINDGRVRVAWVRVWESEGSCVTYKDVRVP